MLKIIYLGTPEFAVPTLSKLIEQPDFKVVAVLCQPDRPKGRGNKLVAPPTKIKALEHGITVLQPEKLARAPEVVQAMRELEPDVIVMVAFGQILKKEVLELAPMGVINVHGSLLPALRGAAPINWAIINGDTTTGVTTMLTEAGVDTGPMLLKDQIAIAPDMTAETLATEMAQVGANLLLKTLRGLLDGSVKPQKQDDSAHTLAPILDKGMGALDFGKSSQTLHDQVRGLCPWPATYAIFKDVNSKDASSNDANLKDARLKIVTTKVAPRAEHLLEPGTLSKESGALLVACGDGKDRLQLVQVQPESRSKMDGLAWANGAHVASGDKLQNG